MLKDIVKLDNNSKIFKYTSGFECIDSQKIVKKVLLYIDDKTPYVAYDSMKRQTIFLFNNKEVLKKKYTLINNQYLCKDNFEKPVKYFLVTKKVYYKDVYTLIDINSKEWNHGYFIGYSDYQNGYIAIKTSNGKYNIFNKITGLYYELQLNHLPINVINNIVVECIDDRSKYYNLYSLNPYNSTYERMFENLYIIDIDNMEEGENEFTAIAKKYITYPWDNIDDFSSYFLHNSGYYVKINGFYKFKRNIRDKFNIYNKNKCGIINSFNNKIIDIKYKEIHIIDDLYICTTIDNKYEYVYKDLKLEPTHDYINIRFINGSEFFIGVYKDKNRNLKETLVNKELKEVNKNEYDKVLGIFDNHIITYDKKTDYQTNLPHEFKKYYVLDYKGNELFSYPNNSLNDLIVIFEDDESNYLVGKKSNKDEWIVFDTNGNIINIIEASHIYFVHNFIVIRNNDKFGLCKYDGTLLLPSVYNYVKPINTLEVLLISDDNCKVITFYNNYSKIISDDITDYMQKNDNKGLIKRKLINE